jgi:hypothetical protein
MREASALGYVRADVAGFAEDAKVGLGLWTVVKTENGNDRTDEVAGQCNAAFTDSIGCAFMSLLNESHSERLLHGSDGTGEFDGASLRTRGVGLHCEAVLFGECSNEFDCLWIRAVTLTILSVRETGWAYAAGNLERGLATDDN